MSTWAVILIVAGAILLTVLFSGLYFTARSRRKIDYMLDALEDGETNFRFRQDGLRHKNINASLNRLKSIYDKEIATIQEKERYYGQLLDKVQTGILIVEPKGERIAYTNQIARQLLGVTGLSTLRQLLNIDTTLYEVFQGNTDQTVTFYTEREKRTLSVSIGADTLEGNPVKLIVFNDISSTIEDYETQSWSKLVRVLTHEIMNTVTPIASLSEALQQVEGNELQAGLQTISQSSRSLIKFVESYRSLNRVAMPIRKAFEVRSLVEEVLELTAPITTNIQTEFIEKSEDTLLYADRSQISQILVNLVKNAVQAGATHITLTAEIDLKDRVILNVENNGEPISPESQEEIFVPFFTTKAEGTGIGLSLSRQIMRQHGGTLRLLKSELGSTVFSLIFP